MTTKKSLLNRLFDRIGIDEADQDLLIIEEDVTDVFDLVSWGTKAGSALTNLSLSAAVLYLKENANRDKGPLDDVLERLLALDEWADNSWEDFIFRRFDLAGDKGAFEELLHLESITKSLVDSLSELSPSDSNQKLKDSDKRKLETQVKKNKNWQCNAESQEVDLYRVVEFLSSNPIVEDDAATVVGKAAMSTGPSISVPYKAFLPLFQHQVEGIERIVSNYESDLGGLILADEMGLGKTRQVVVTILSLMQKQQIKRACIVSPPSIIPAWLKEVKKVLPGFSKLTNKMEVVKYSSHQPADKRDPMLRQARAKDKLLLVITSNKLVGTQPSKRYGCPLFPTGKESGLTWDVVVVDEAHDGAKNPKTLLGDALRSRASKFTLDSFILLLTATPIENNLKEFCNLLALVAKEEDKKFLDFIKHKKDKDIYHGQQKSASMFVRKRATKLIDDFQEMASPYIIQRSMHETLKDQLPPKQEYQIWVRPSWAQWEATRMLLQSDKAELAKATGNKISIFAMIQRQRMICFHPLFAEQVNDIDVQNFLSKQENTGEEVDVDELMASYPDPTDDDDVIDKEATAEDEHEQMSDYLSGKKTSDILRDSPLLRVCKDFLVPLTEQGHKILVFSLFRKPLDFLARILEDSKLGFYRIDGQVRQSLRDKHMDDFNQKKSRHKIMLITTKAGGLGLTLTGADTVIILGPSWNPMVDAQAIGRAYRIGQKRSVRVFRINMASLIDELIVGKQIQKEALIREVQMETGGCLPRYLDDKDLSNLLTLNKRGSCEILDRLASRKVDPDSLPMLGGHKMVHGILQHEAIYRKFPYRFGGKREVSMLPSDSVSESQNKSRKLARKVSFSTNQKEENVEQPESTDTAMQD